MKTNISRGLLALCMVAVIVAALAVSRSLKLLRVNEALRAENQSLRDQGMARAAQEQMLGEGDETEVGLGRTEKMELMRLGNEVTQLRASAKAARDAVKDALENRMPRENGAPQGTGMIVDVPAVKEFPRDGWAFRGYATPEDALVSGLWAMKEGRMDTLLASMAPALEAELEKEIAGQSEADVARTYQKQMDGVSNLVVSGQKQVSPREVLLELNMDGDEGAKRTLKMVLVGNEWKAATPFIQSYDPLAFYRRNPELMRRYFPHLMSREVQQAADATAPGGSLPPEPSPDE